MCNGRSAQQESGAVLSKNSMFIYGGDQKLYTAQELMIKRGGGRACNFRRFWTGQNNPPVLFIEYSLRGKY